MDPVTANSVNGSNFNRYWYANNNPYKFTDPDGRLAFLIPVAIIAYRAYSAYDTVTSTIDNAETLADPNATGAQKLAATAEIAGGLAAGKGGRQLAGSAARLVDKARDSLRRGGGGRGGKGGDGSSGGGDGGSPRGECATCGGKTTASEKLMAQDHGLSKKEVGDAIHAAKRSGGSATEVRNGDVEVCRNCGEIYPQTPRGLGDTIGNIKKD